MRVHMGSGARPADDKLPNGVKLFPCLFWIMSILGSDGESFVHVPIRCGIKYA